MRIVINHTFTAATFLVPKQRAYWVQLQTVWVFQPVKFTICFLSTKELEVLVFPLKTLDHVQRTSFSSDLKCALFIHSLIRSSVSLRWGDGNHSLWLASFAIQRRLWSGNSPRCLSNRQLNWNITTYDILVIFVSLIIVSNH